ncbi:10651_t:CDS:2 [Entrophospora sp. SA101]|nr:11179_t:CDS:2 [Entrophospora sp. SA101]CAJ0749158.1 10651_t:CDS:2 [Entrophospora sp. SA101]CAJ0859062.1 12844_t:CDS:2 [Entrophospora sp. SA101]CAJ0920278.1 4036_t:CDS:2 [Entrophospora sp. SA101]
MFIKLIKVYKKFRAFVRGEDSDDINDNPKPRVEYEEYYHGNQFQSYQDVLDEFVKECNKERPPPYDNFKQNDSVEYFDKERLSINSNSISEVGGPPDVYKILLVGGTGVGKSTLINAMANFFRGGTLDNLKVVIPTNHLDATEIGFRSSEANSNDQTKSQTTECHTYCFNHPENKAHRFIFIDTPGLSDTNGVDQDDRNIHAIIDTAIRVGSISAIVVVANGTESRMTATAKNTLVRLANNIPNAIVENNLFLVLTKCTEMSASFSVKDFAADFAEPSETFYVDNQAFCNHPKTWLNDEDKYKRLDSQWKESEKTINDMLIKISRLAPIRTIVFKQMKSLRDDIKCEILRTSQVIANIQIMHDLLDGAQKDKKKYENYTKTEEVTISKIVDATNHSTVCITHFKTNNIFCHENCGLNFTPTPGEHPFRDCYCMNDYKVCKKCGCGPTSHLHKRIKVIKETKKIDKVLEDMKAKYDEHKSKADNYKTKLADLEATANKQYTNIHKYCADLRKVCTRFNFVDELSANIEVIKLDARNIKNVDLREKSEAEIKKLVELVNELSTNSGLSSP